MALKFINETSVPAYICLSTDIVLSTIAGLSLVGKLVFTTDTAEWYIIENDLTLSPYALPVTFAGTISVGAVSTGVSAAATDGIGDFLAVITAPGAVSSAPLSVMPLVYNGTTWDRLRGNTNGLQALDMGAGWTSVYTNTVSADLSSTTIVTAAPTAGQKLIITDIVLSADTDMNVIFAEETSGTVMYKAFIKSGVPFQISPRSKMKLATVNKKLTGKASVSGNISITVSYYSEA